MALIGLMTAILCLIAPVSVLLPISPVPVSLGTLAIYFVSLVLGRKKSVICVSLYLLLGFAGLPVFTGFTGGVGKLLGPTGGYMIGYLFMALICGYVTDRWSQNIAIILCGMLLGTAVCYLFGTIWLTFQAKLTFPAALGIGVLPFLPGDFLKMGIAAAIGYQVRIRIKKAALL